MNNLRRCSIRNKLIGFVCMGCFAVCISAQESSPATEMALDPHDLAAGAQERVWLDIGNGKDLAFYLSEKSGTAHGGVLIVPNKGIHPAVTGTVNSLRHTLAKHHWHTLALDISPLDAGAIQQDIAAGVAYLNSQGVFNIAILGDGQGAVYALQYVASLPPPEKGQFEQIRALVMLNADNMAEGTTGDPMAVLAHVRLPVLDAWYANDFSEQQKAKHRRSLTAGTSALYQQARIPYATVQSSEHENRVTKRIRGWLDKNIAGFMVDKSSGQGAGP